MDQYKFAPSYHIKNIKNLKENNIQHNIQHNIEIEYNKLMQTLKTYYKENNLANFEKNKN